MPEAHAGAQGVCPDCGRIVNVPVMLQRGEPELTGRAPAPPTPAPPAAVATMSGQAPAPDFRQRVPVGPRTAPAATWSLTLGILGCILVGLGALTGIPGMVLGAVGLKHIKASEGRLIGRSRARTGIVLNGISLLLFAAVVIAIAELTPIISDSIEQGQIESGATMWYSQCSSYAYSNNNDLPPDLQTAMSFSPYAIYGSGSAPGDFRYYGKDRKIDEPGRRLLLYAEEADRKGRRWAVFMDGQSKRLSEEELHKELKAIGVPEDEWP